MSLQPKKILTKLNLKGNLMDPYCMRYSKQNFSIESNHIISGRYKIEHRNDLLMKLDETHDCP